MQHDTMTPREVAGRLRLSVAQVYQMVERNLIPHRRVGVSRGKILIDRADVEASWAAAKSSEVAPQPEPKPAPAIIPAYRHLRSRSRA